MTGFQATAPASDSHSGPEDAAVVLSAGHGEFERCSFHILAGTGEVTSSH